MQTNTTSHQLISPIPQMKKTELWQKKYNFLYRPVFTKLKQKAVKSEGGNGTIKLNFKFRRPWFATIKK